MIKVVLFDLDGVLIDACEWHYQALNSALNEVCGFIISREEHDTVYNGLSTMKKLQTLRYEGRIKTADQANKVWILKQARTEEKILANSVRDLGKIHMLQALKLEFSIQKIGCVTNAIRKSAELMLSVSGQLPFIDFIVSNEDVSRNKPFPDAYLKAIKMSQVDPESVLIIEDSDIGIQSAQASGANYMRVKDTSEVNISTISSYIEKLNKES